MDKKQMLSSKELVLKMSVVGRPKWTDVWSQHSYGMMRAQRFWVCACDRGTPTRAGALHKQTIYSPQTHCYALLVASLC